MSNPKITAEHSNTQLTLPLEVKEENSFKKDKLPPKLKPYNNNKVSSSIILKSLFLNIMPLALLTTWLISFPMNSYLVHYSGGGRPSFHPKMMLKVILYAYSQKVYSCRDIEILIQENLPAMWLAAMKKPDFRMINDFRGKRMKAMMDKR